MMYDWANKFSGLVLGTFPNITGKNASGPTASDGTPFTADYINDIWGHMQDVLNAAGLTPNGQAEAAGSSQFLTALQRGAGLPPGTILMAAWNQFTQAIMRTTPMNGQLLPIGEGSPYLDLVSATYVGDDHNSDANLEGYYKCDANGNRNTTGAYFRIPDIRGLFLRAAGQNGTKKMANDAPYDGNAIGAFIGDAIRNIKGSCYPQIDANSGGNVPIQNVSGAIYATALYQISYLARGATVTAPSGIGFDASLVVPAALENRPASISAYVCIKY
jgi:hypothetical protein